MRRLLTVLTVVIAAAALTSCGHKETVKRPVGPPDPWKMVSYDSSGGYGTYLGNGSIGVRINAEGVGSHQGLPLHCLLAGFYQDEELLPLPNFSDLPVYAGDKVDVDKRFHIDTELPYEQTLDMKSGLLHTKYTLRQGHLLMDADVLFIVSRESDRVDVIMSLIPMFNGDVTVRTGFGKPAKGLKILSDSSISGTGRAISCRIEGQPDEVSIAAGLNTIGRVKRTSQQKLATDTVISVEKNKLLTLHKAVTVTRESTIPKLRYPDVDTITASSRSAWGDIWKSRIEIEGDPEAQQAVNSCVFYLLQSVKANTDYSIPPMGLSHDSWHGHIFWDADTWMFPALLPLYPQKAESIVDYRFKTLGGAKQNAKSRGLKGAEYAWESARSGLETIALPYSEERHITSDVALAQWQFYQTTQDKDWLQKRGYPVISACADYWVTRSKYNSVKDRYEILNVMSPDEDAEIVNNSAYTNASARKTLEIAARAASILGQPVSPDWLKVAGKMYIPFDNKNKRYIEFDGFNRPHTKQADTELLIYPLEIPMSDDVRNNTFNYWAAKVNPRGPAMSSSVHAVIAARLGKTEDAYRYFTDSYKPFFRKPFNYFNEKRSMTYENMYFMTGAAGPIQAVIYGFCGLRYRPDGSFTVEPNLPSKWKSVTLRNVYSAGKRYDITIRKGQKPIITPAAL